jgi:hypothetical protein
MQPGTTANAEKFRKILAEREITEEELVKCIGRYASKIHWSPRNVVMARDNLKFLLCNAAMMSDSVLQKGLLIIGLTPDEISAVTTAA